MKRILAFACGLALVAAPVAAQAELLTTCSTLTAHADPEPPGGVPDDVNEQFQFLCGQVVNVLTNVQPSIGIAFTGGNHTLGTATTIGRRLGLFPRISVTARVNAALVDAPDFSGFTASVSDGEQVQSMPTAMLPFGALQGDVVIGLFNGISLGPLIGGLGSIDLLGSVSFIPALPEVQDAVGLEKDIINLGGGARIGILRQGLLMPGISVSGMYRKMSEVRFGDVGAGDPFSFATDLTTISLRGAISKGILMFDVAAGGGYDQYTSNVELDWELEYECPPTRCGVPQTVRLRPADAAGNPSPISGELSTAAWNVFGNVGLSLLLINVVGEVGFQKPMDLLTPEDFQDANLPDQPPTEEVLEGGRFFVSFGVRLTI